jgi:hypothetical protein
VAARQLFIERAALARPKKSCAGRSVSKTRVNALITRASIFFAKRFTKLDGLPGQKRVHARLPTRYARQ